ncbi:hypothetical protein DFJ73DRAFT_953986 [Zopfochytrium polystomum]|nr:hypothetical protein DFJ73DRAFT_953986 [Zopfochytrium polystomum]
MTTTTAAAAKKVALVVGASRGIGAAVAHALGAASWHVVVAAKSATATPATSTSTAPQAAPPTAAGSVDSVRDEILRAGHSASAVRLNVRNPDDVRAAVRAVLVDHGRIDAVVYNAGAIWWGSVASADLKRFDLLQEVNIRGLYAVVQEVLPIYQRQSSGRFLVVSPPIYSRFFRGKTSYAIGKVGMTVLTMGLAMELEGSGIAISSLWPAYGTQSAVTDKYKMPLADLMKPTIFADAVVGILGEVDPARVNGKAFIDEDYLREYRGVTDFAKYRVVPDSSPRRMLPAEFPSLLVKEQDDRGVSLQSLTKSML